MIAYIEELDVNVEMPDGLSDEEIQGLANEYILKDRKGGTFVEDEAEKKIRRFNPDAFAGPDVRGLSSEQRKQLNLSEEELFAQEQRQEQIDTTGIIEVSEPSFYRKFIEPVLQEIGAVDIPLVQDRDPRLGVLVEGAIEGFTGFDPRVFDKGQNDYPITSGIGFIGGGVGSLLTAQAGLNLTKLPQFASLLGTGAAITANIPRLATAVPAVIMTSSTFGTQTFFTELISQSQEGQIDLQGLGGEVIKSAGLGVFLGTTGQMKGRGLAITTAAAGGYTYTRMNGGSHEEGILSGSIFAIFEAIGGMKRNEKIVKDLEATLIKLTAKYVRSNTPKMGVKESENIAFRILQEQFDIQAAKGKFIERGKEMEFLNQFNQRVIEAIKRTRIKDPKAKPAPKKVEATPPKAEPKAPPKVEPKVEPKAQPPVQPTAPKEIAKGLTGKAVLNETAQQIAGKDFDKLTAAQKRKVINQSEVAVPASEITIEEALKIAPKDTFVKDLTDSRFGLASSTAGEFFSDGRFLIVDQGVADKLRQEVRTKFVTTETKNLQKQGKSFTEAKKEAEKLAVERFDTEIELPDFNAVIPAGKGQPGKFVGIKSDPSGTASAPQSLIFDTDQGPVALNASKFKLIKENFPKTELEFFGPEKPVKFVDSSGDTKAILLPIRIGDSPLVQSLVQQAQPVEAPKKPAKKKAKKVTPQEKADALGKQVDPKQPEGEAPLGQKGIDAFEKIKKDSTFQFKPKNKPDTTEGFKLFEATKGLAQKYARFFGEKWNPKGTLGVFYRNSKNVFFDSLNNIGVVVHEVLHFVDDKNKLFSRILNVLDLDVTGRPIYDPKTLKHRQELTKIYVDYYPGAKHSHNATTRIKEGLAVLIQKMVESPSIIKEKYPFLVKEFLTPGGEFFVQDIADLVDDAQKIVAEYQKLNPLEKIGARVVSAQNKVGKGSFMSKREIIDTELFDATYPYEALAKTAGVRETKEDISLVVRFYEHNLVPILRNNMQPGKGLWAMGNDGNFRKVSEKNYGDLVVELGKKGMRDQFDYWLVARRVHFGFQHSDELAAKIKEQEALFVEKMSEAKVEKIEDIEDKELQKEIRGIVAQVRQLKAEKAKIDKILKSDKIPRSEADAAFNQMKEQFKNEARIFDKITEESLRIFNNPLIDRLDTATMNEMLDREGYATFKRDTYNEILGDEIRARVSGGPKTTVRKASFLMERTGSDAPIISPLMETMKNFNEAYRIALRQRIYNVIAKAYAPIMPDLFQVEKLETSIDKKTGKVVLPQMSRKDTIMGRVGGKWVPVRTNEEVRRLLEETFDFNMAGTLERVAKTFSRMFTKGTTGVYIPFAFVNATMDQVTAMGNTQNHYKPFVDQIQLLRQAFRESDSEVKGFMEEYFRLGGDRQTWIRMYELAPDEFFTRLDKEVSGVKTWIDLVEKGLDIASLPVQVSELTTRATEYIKARQAGKSQMLAFDESARVSVPFGRTGRATVPFKIENGRLVFKQADNRDAIGRTLMMSAPYLKAGFQAFRQFVRSQQDPRIRQRLWMVWLTTTMASIGGVGALLMNSSDDQKRLLRGLKPTDLGRNLYFPHPTKKSKLGKIRVGDEFLGISTIMNMILIDLATSNNFTAQEYIQGATSMIPDGVNVADPLRMFLAWMPQVIKPTAEVAFNVRTFPEVMPLESLGMRNLPPEMRTKQTTSDFARSLAIFVNDANPLIRQGEGLSPIQIDHLMEGHFGRAVKFVTGKKEFDPWGTIFEQEIDSIFMGMRQISEYYTRKIANDQLFGRRKTVKYTDAEFDSILEERANIKNVTAALKDYKLAFKELETLKEGSKRFVEVSKELEGLRREVLDEIDTLPEPPARIKGLLKKTRSLDNDSN